MIVLPDEGVDLRALERSLVVQALRRTRGNQTRAGQLLGLTRDQMRYRIESRKILPSEYRRSTNIVDAEEDRP